MGSEFTCLSVQYNNRLMCYHLSYYDLKMLYYDRFPSTFSLAMFPRSFHLSIFIISINQCNRICQIIGIIITLAMSFTSTKWRLVVGGKCQVKSLVEMLASPALPSLLGNHLVMFIGSIKAIKSPRKG